MGWKIRIATAITLAVALAYEIMQFQPNDLQNSAGKLIESMRRGDRTNLQVEIGGKRHEFELETSIGVNFTEQKFTGYWLKFDNVQIGPQLDIDSLSLGKIGDYKLPFGKYSNHQLRLMTRNGEPTDLNDSTRQELIRLLNSANDSLKVLQERERKGIGSNLLTPGSVPDRSWLTLPKEIRNQKARLPQKPFVAHGGFRQKV